MKHKYFHRSEFACHCDPPCGFEAVDIDLLDILTKVREKFGPVIIHCACRCKKKNDEVGSRDTSQHLKGMAADYHVRNVDNEKIYYFLDTLFLDKYGIGIYDWGIHTDIRRKKARWDMRSKHD